MSTLSAGNWTLADFDKYCSEYNIKHKIDYFPLTAMGILRENLVDIDIFRSMERLVDF